MASIKLPSHLTDGKYELEYLLDFQTYDYTMGYKADRHKHNVVKTQLKYRELP